MPELAAAPLYNSFKPLSLLLLLKVLDISTIPAQVL